MFIWNREYSDDRTYFKEETGLIQHQDSKLTIKFLGIPVLIRKLNFTADILDKKPGLGFNSK